MFVSNMVEMCLNVPYVDNKPSKLYKDIYSFTKGNRKITNFVYAMALQSWYKAKFSSSDFNSQNELNAEVVIQDLHLQDYLTIQDTIKEIERTLRATDSEGNPIEYDTVDEIIDRVLDINSQDDSKIVARILNSNGKYIISVLPKNDTNYNVYEQYKTGIELLEAIKGALSSVGFNVSLLSEESQQALNIINAQNFSVLLDKLLKIEQPTYLSENQVALILQLMRGDIKIDRLYAKFRSKTVQVVQHLLTGRRDIPEDLDGFELLIRSVRPMFTLLRKEISIKANNINAANLANNLYNLYAGIKNTRKEDIGKTLKELYKNWNIDTDVLEYKTKEIRSLEDAVQQSINSLYNNIKFLQSKGHVTVTEKKELESKIRLLLRRKRKKEYFSSILGFLEEVAEELNTLKNIDLENLNETEYNEVSFQILYAKQLMNNYYSVVDSLTHIDTLDQASELEVADIDKIKELAGTLKEKLDTLEKNIKDKWFTVTYKYLKEKWGEDDTKSFSLDGKSALSSFEVSLKHALEFGTDININLYDRLLASLTEVSDPVLAVFGQGIKDLHEIRNDKMLEILTQIRRATNALYESGSTADFMFETLSDGTVKITSGIDYEAYYADRQNAIENWKQRGIKGEELKRRILHWEDDNTEEYTVPGLQLLEAITGEPTQEVKIMAPKSKYRKAMPDLTDAQRDYYKTMMSLKASMEYNLLRHGVSTQLFSPVQITSEISDALGSVPVSEAFKLLKDNFVDNFSIREDDTNYGTQEVLTDSNGNELRQLPTYYIRKLSDQKRLNKDFSKAMLAYAAMATNFSVMSEHINTLELVKEFLLDREIEQKRGNKRLVQSVGPGSDKTVTPVMKKTRETPAGKWLLDIMDTKVYSIRHQLAGTIGDTNISLDKLADTATAYSSVTGLAVNAAGAIANALVGKLLMIIEAGGREFFGFKDFTNGTLEYWKLLPELLQELYSNDKKSKLGLLMEKFDVLDDFYDKLKETGFYTKGINKIIGNTSLFFLYGLGEHLLHAQGMLACLFHTKVLNDKNEKVPLIKAFTVDVVEGNGKLKIKDGYKTLDNKLISQEFILRQKRNIAYVNRSLLGAFGDDEKGLIHQYAFGRLVMNFRQWMPAHYARRFNKLHYDALLGDYREGYYITCGKFVLDCAKQIKKGQFDLLTRYKNLTDIEKSNIRRAFTETMILIVLTLLSRMSFGDDPKHRTKAQALLKYEIKRMLMETTASTPIKFKGFINNIYKTFNEPIAALSPAKRFTTLFGIDDLIFMRRVEDGPHEGELIYFRNLKRALPFYDLLYKLWHIDTDNAMFQLFNEL